MKLSGNTLWMVLLICLAGCQNALQTEGLKGLAAEYQELAMASPLDGSGAWAGAPLRTPREVANLPAMDSASPGVASAAQAVDQPPRRLRGPKLSLTIPAEIPGSEDPGFRLPKDQAELDKYINALYPALPALEGAPLLAPGPEGRPLTLADLQRLAGQYSPAIQAAQAAVTAARGAVRQSLAYPNPTVAFEEDTTQTGPAGYPGFFIDQLIKTGNKLELQGAAATMDLFNAQLALRRARFDVANQVRSNYFAILVAQENVRMSRALARLMDDIYAAQVTLLKGKEAAAYEPMQLRPLALQARFNLTQAINQYHASWRQLVANLGLPDMPPAEVAGRVDLPVPEFDYEQVKNYILKRHTDVLTAENNIHKADYVLRLARIQPVPDVDVRLLVQKDYTTPPFYIAHSVQVSVALPVWDLNRGAILQAQMLLTQAMQNLSVTRNTLIVNLADAHNRYLTYKKQTDMALKQTQDQVRVYKAVYNRFRGGDLGVTFGDVVAAQQALAGYLTGYLSALGLQWTAVVDVANLLQTEDLFEGTAALVESPLQHLESMLRCPCPQSDPAYLPPVRARLEGPTLTPGDGPDQAR
jgi:cobalt-zinc-cadmium efflux system outer membrane protein